jgi:hypothetical protein
MGMADRPEQTASEPDNRGQPDVNGEGAPAIAELATLRDELVHQVGKPIEWPEPGLTLNYGDRRNSDMRMFKYLHQMCLLHRSNFVSSNQIRHLYLIDGFLTTVDAQNPFALYALARSMFELSAFLHEVKTRLQEVVLRINDNTWQPLGEKFFGLIVRARYATTHPDYLGLLLTHGVPASRLKPFNITNCVQGLAAEREHQDATKRYQLLCDFVHHNLGSSSMAKSGSAVSDASRSSGGGMLVVRGGSTSITRYEYPAKGKADRALNGLAGGFLKDTRACIGWLDTTPESPFPWEMVMEKTGSPFGVQELRPPSL